MSCRSASFSGACPLFVCSAVAIFRASTVVQKGCSNPRPKSNSGSIFGFHLFGRYPPVGGSVFFILLGVFFREHQKTIILGIKNKLRPSLLVWFPGPGPSWSWSGPGPSPGVLPVSPRCPPAFCRSARPVMPWSLGLLVCWSPGLLSYPKPTLNQTTPTLN